MIASNLETRGWQPVGDALLTVRRLWDICRLLECIAAPMLSASLARRCRGDMHGGARRRCGPAEQGKDRSERCSIPNSEKLSVGIDALERDSRMHRTDTDHRPRADLVEHARPAIPGGRLGAGRTSSGHLTLTCGRRLKAAIGMTFSSSPSSHRLAGTPVLTGIPMRHRAPESSEPLH